MKNVDQIISFLLKNADNLKADKIQAFSSVINSLKGTEHEKEPNAVREKEDDFLTESEPIDFSEVEGIQVDNQPIKKTKIYKG